MASSISHATDSIDANAGDCAILLNGAPHAIRGGSTVRTLLDDLELGVERVAVEVDRRIVRRTEWSERKLSAGSVVEVVHFVGGG